MAFTGSGTGTAAGAASGKTLANLETICQYNGWKDRSTAGEAELDNFINETIQLLTDLAPWPEYHRVDGAQSFLRVTDTIENITGDGSTVTITATSHPVATNDIGDVTGTTNYDVCNKLLTDAGTNSVTYVDDCSATAETTGTLTWGDQKILSDSQIERVGCVWRDDLNHPLELITTEEWMHRKTYEASTGPPTCYALRTYMSSGLPKVIMMVYPTPTTAITLFYPYKRYPTILSSDSDTTDWPTNRIYLLTEALKTRLKDKDPMALHGTEFMTKVNMAFNSARNSYMPIIAKPIGVTRKWHINDINRHNMTVTS
ncbi:MAG: hypothetical protein ACYS30_18155 [Planctomycetota bacterium]|jgi:hypothetical protein